MAGGDTANMAARGLAEAHRALRADPDIQFTMRPVEPTPPPPAWLEDVGRWLARIFGPIGRFLGRVVALFPPGIARWLLWAVLGALALLLVWMIVTRLRVGAWRWPRRRRATAVAIEQEENWVPEAGPARALLREADTLAGQGRFAEAVHLLLLRGVEDIAGRRPALARPALTSRDLAAAEAIPPAPRSLFAGIAAVVERSLFGARAVGEDDWREARAAYADFALPRAWATA